MGIFGGPFFSQLRVEARFSCSQNAPNGILRDKFLCEQMRTVMGGGEGLGGISQRPQRPHPGRGHEGRSQRPTQRAEVLTRTAAESKVMVRMTWASGADRRKTLSQALKQGPGALETAVIGRPPAPSEQAPVPSPHLGGGGKTGRGQGRTPPAGQRHR